MLDLVEFLVRPLALTVLWIFRALLWLGLELMFSIIGWTVGWCVCRILTLNRIPSVGIRDGESYELIPRLLVELIGLGSLFLLAWWLAGILNA